MKVVLPLFALTLSSFTLAAPDSATEKPPFDLQAEIKNIESEIAGLSQSLDQKKAQFELSHRRHHEEIDSQAAKARALAEKLAASEKQLAAFKQGDDANAKRIAELEKALSDQKKASDDAANTSKAAIAEMTKKFETIQVTTAKALASSTDKSKADAAIIAKLNSQVGEMTEQRQLAQTALDQLRKNLAELTKAVSATAIGEDAESR
jgi:chromosome segregation ATPase